MRTHVYLCSLCGATKSGELGRYWCLCVKPHKRMLRIKPACSPTVADRESFTLEAKQLSHEGLLVFAWFCWQRMRFQAQDEVSIEMREHVGGDIDVEKQELSAEDRTMLTGIEEYVL